MNKTNKPLKNDLTAAVDAYVDALLSMWSDYDADDPQLSPAYGHWAGDDPTGVYCYEDMFSITLTDVVYCVDNGVPMQEYLDWQDYCVEAAQWGFTTPNLRSWHTGCPRVPEETFATLRGRKQQLDDLVEIVKQHPDISI